MGIYTTTDPIRSASVLWSSEAKTSGAGCASTEAKAGVPAGQDRVTLLEYRSIVDKMLILAEQGLARVIVRDLNPLPKGG